MRRLISREKAASNTLSVVFLFDHNLHLLVVTTYVIDIHASNLYVAVVSNDGHRSFWHRQTIEYNFIVSLSLFSLL